MRNQENKQLKVLAIIPVRLESSRLPNKPLALIANKPLVIWVWEHALLAKCFTKVIIATDSEEIRSVAVKAGAEVVMTSTEALNGTERVAEALEKIDGEWDIIFNVQGDMPFIQPEVIEKVAESFCLNLRDFEMATLALPIKDEAEYLSSNCVKVVFGLNSKALYFSRAPVPNYRNGFEVTSNLSQAPISYKHIGLYAFRPEALKKIVGFRASPLEKAESLEQLRALENNLSILVVAVERQIAGPSIEVDTPLDLEKAQEVAKTYLMPQRNRVS